jgi:hypothetical protein
VKGSTELLASPHVELTSEGLDVLLDPWPEAVIGSPKLNEVLSGDPPGVSPGKLSGHPAVMLDRVADKAKFINRGETG